MICRPAVGEAGGFFCVRGWILVGRSSYRCFSYRVRLLWFGGARVIKGELDMSDANSGL